MRRIAVFGRSGVLAGPDEMATGQRVGRLLGENGLTLVYDGSAVGVIGTVAEASAQAGGRLIGIARSDSSEPLREDLAEQRSAATLEQWRSEVALLADAWLALPGAFESLEDAFAVWDWSDSGRPEQPLGLLDQGDYYSALLRHASDSAVDRFVLESQRGRLITAKQPGELLRRLADYRPPETRRDASFDDD